MAILLHDFREVVDVVDVEVVQIGGGWVDVAWDAEVHDEKRAIRTRRHSLLKSLPRKYCILRGDGRNDDIRRGKRGVTVAPFDDATAELRGEGLRFVVGKIHYVKMA